MKQYQKTIFLIVIYTCVFYLMGTPTANAQVFDFFVDPTATPAPTPEITATPIPTEEPPNENTTNEENSPQPVDITVSISPTNTLDDSLAPFSEGIIVTDGLNNVIVRDRDILYVGGTFNEIVVENNVSIPRRNLGAVDVTVNRVLDWNPNPNDRINTIHTDPTSIYVGGEFTNIANQDKLYFAEFRKQTFVLTDWNLFPNNSVTAIDSDNEFIYLGGNFTEIDGEERLFFAIFDRETKQLVESAIRFESPVNAIANDDEFIYVGGTFTSVNGEESQSIIRIRKDDQSVSNIQDEIVGEVTSIELVEDRVVVTTAETSEETNELVARQITIDRETTETIETTQITPPVVNSLQSDRSLLQADPRGLGFEIPSLGDILTFIIQAFFTIAGIVALFYLLTGGLSWVTSGGEEENIEKARNKIVAAIIGVIVIVAVVAVIATLEQVVFSETICFGISCPATIPQLLQPYN